jgi:hypothetical protein
VPKKQWKNVATVDTLRENNTENKEVEKTDQKENQKTWDKAVEQVTSDLPPGEYVVEAWHAELGTQEQTVTVETGETAQVSFTFTEDMLASAVVPMGDPIDPHDHNPLVEYLAGWSAGAPILLLCLARPDLMDARPTWGAGIASGARCRNCGLPQNIGNTFLVPALIRPPQSARVATSGILGAGERGAESRRPSTHQLLRFAHCELIQSIVSEGVGGPLPVT